MDDVKLPELGLIAASTLAIYIYLIIVVRVFGKRQLAQLSPLDLAVFLCLGSAVETAMVRSSTSLAAGLVSATTLLIANRLIAFISHRSKKFSRVLGGRPVIVVRDGQMLPEAMRRQGLTEQDLIEAIHMREVCHISDVRYAFVEADGTINVVKKSTGHHAADLAST